MLEIPVCLFARVFLSTVVSTISRASQACLVSQFILVSLVSIVSLGRLVIVVSLSILVIVVLLAILVILVSFFTNLPFYRISPYSVG